MRAAAPACRCPTPPATWCSAARCVGLRRARAGCSARAATRSCPGAGAVAWPTPSPPGLAPPYAGGAYDGAAQALVNAHKEHGVLALAGAARPGARRRGRATCCADARRRTDTGASWCRCPSRRRGGPPPGHDPLLRMTRRGRRPAAPAGRAAPASGSCWCPPAGCATRPASTRGSGPANLAGIDAARRGPRAPDGPRAGGGGRRRAHHRGDRARGAAGAGGRRRAGRRGRHRGGDPSPVAERRSSIRGGSLPFSGTGD